MPRLSLACLLNLLTLLTVGPVYGVNLLADPGFESSALQTGNWPRAFGLWGGDLAETVGAEGSALPWNQRMLKFTSTDWRVPAGLDGMSGDVAQMVDLTPYADLIAAGAARIQFSALFNRQADNGTGTTDTAFAIRVFANEGDVRSFFDATGRRPNLAFKEVSLESDDDPSTWQQVAGRLAIPPGSTYLAVMLRATENVLNDPPTGGEFAGHYADNVVVQIVPEPACGPLALAAMIILTQYGAGATGRACRRSP